jgi:hypothetical protein
MWIATTVFCSTSVVGGGLRDLEDGWIVPIPLVNELLKSPMDAGQDNRTGFNGWLSLGQSRLFGMAELPVYCVATGVSRGFFQLDVAWQRLGSELYCEDQLRLKAVLGSRWRLMVIGGAEVMHLPRESADVQTVVEWGVMSPPRDRLFFQAVWPLLPPSSWQGGRQQRRWLRVAGRLVGARWALALDRSGMGVPSFQIGAIVKVAGGLGWGVRSEPSTGSVGITTCWLWSSWLLRTSHIAHPDLGVTHRWSLTGGHLAGVW